MKSQPPHRAIERHRARELTARVRANVRNDFGTEEELVALGRSYMERPIHPIVIRPDLTPIDGERRLRGVMMLDPEHLMECIVVAEEFSPAEVMELQLISALHSEKLTPYDEAVAIREWMQQNAGTGATAKQLAEEKLDRDPSTVTKLVALWNTVPAVQAAAAAGRVGPKAWYPISLLPPADQTGLLEMHIAGLSGEQIAAISRQKRAPASAEAGSRLSRIRCEVPGRAATVTVAGEAMTLEAMISTLTDLLSLARKEAQKGVGAETFVKVCRDLSKKK